MPIKGGGKKASASAAVEEANKDLEDLDLSGIDFDSITDPDSGPDVPTDDDIPSPEWEEDAPEVPGEEELSLDDLGIPPTDNVSILAEYLPAIKDEIATLVGVVQDQHNYHKTRGEQALASFKALHDSLGNRIDTLEAKVHELVSMVRAQIQGTAPAGKLEDVKHADAKLPPKEADKPKGKTPPAAKTPTVAEVATQVGIPNLPKILSALRQMKDGQELTVDKFKQWLEVKGSVPAAKGAKIVELLKLKGPITKATFPAA